MTNLRKDKNSLNESFTYSTTRPLFGHVAIVTGASRGIGREIAISLARAGAHVAVNYRESETAAYDVVNICNRLGSRAVAIQADVSNEGDVSRLVETTERQLGTPRIVVNNAGITTEKLLLDLSLEEWNQLLAVNLTSTFLVTRSVLPRMLSEGYGRIINMSSIWGLVGGATESAYSAAKGGLIALSKALAKEVGRSGITVNVVAPGAIDTDMISALDEEGRLELEEATPVGRLGQPADVASAVLYLANPDASFITGQVISPNGGLVV